MKRNPKFKLGEVVCEKATGLYRRIYARDECTDGSVTYAVLHRDGANFHILPSELRPLTKRERGS